MSNNNRNSKIRIGWRGILLHPLFYNILVCLFTIIESTTILLDNLSDPTSINSLINFSVLTISVAGLILTILNIGTQKILHIVLVAALIMPAANILIDGADLRITIYYLPLAYLLLLGKVSHKLTPKTYSLCHIVVLGSLLISMTSSDIQIEANSIPMQIMLVTIIILATFLLIVLYLWNKTKSFLLPNEKRLTDKIGSVIRTFSKILIESDNVETVLHNVAQRIIPDLEFEECVIYLVDKDENMLVQKAAYGAKSSTESSEVINPISIRIGEGIVGSVAATGQAEIIHDTTKDDRYIQDDAMRYSELTVPIIVKGKVVGVIDTEHPSKNFFNEVQLYLMQIIASLCASKIIEIEHRLLHQQSVKLGLESKKLQETNDIKSRFIANLSHDLKTPLTLILGPSNELLKHDFSESDLEYIELINDNGKELKGIIDELLELNEMSFLSQASSIKEVDFGLLMTIWCEKYNQRCLQKEISFSVVGQRKLITPLDQRKMAVIIYNLFDNALKFTPENGKIGFEYGISNEELHITIEDSGPGIESAHHEKIFHRFYKSEYLSNTGTGVGLSVVKQLVESLGGRIAVSKSEWGGAKFKIVLNCSAKESELESKKTTESPISYSSPEKSVVLIVEDHDDLRQFIQLSLEGDFICVSAADGKKGLELAKKLIPDIIITDLMLPELTGEELCQEVRSDQNLNHVPVIVLSAKSMTLNKVELYKLGAENYLTKPFEIEELKAIIQNTIQQRINLRLKFKSSFVENETSVIEDSFIIKVKELVEENMNNADFNVIQLSSLLQTGRNQLQRKIKMLTDMTPVEFIRFIRLKKAMEYLRGSDLTISEIAFEVGFNNLSYFTRSFKQTFDHLPSDVRQNSVAKKEIS